MKRLLILAVLTAAIGGCNFGHKTEKDQAYQRWHLARAHVLYGVGAEQLKNGDLDKAQSYAAQAVALDKEYVPARVLAAKILLEKGQYAEAADELRKVEAMVPSDAEIPYLLGAALEKLDNPGEALKCYQRARALDTANDAYVTASAEVLVKLTRPKQALELLEARLERVNGNPAMLTLAGELAMMVNQPGRAAEFYQRCLDLGPNTLPVREGLAKALFFAGKHAQALQELNRLAEDPKYREKTAWVYLMTGDAYLATGRAAEARGAYETASRIEPEDALIWVCLAKAATLLRDHPRAILAARQALALTGESAEAALILGYALLQEQQAGQAVAVLKAAADKNPHMPALWVALGRCYAHQGRGEQAAACYMQALRTDPEDRLAKSLLGAAAAPEGTR